MKYRVIQQTILLLSRNTKQLIVVAVDVLLCLLSVWLSYSLRLDAIHLPSAPQLGVYLSAPLILVPIFYLNGLYRAIFRYSGLVIIRKILFAVFLFFIVYAVFLLLISYFGWIQLQTRELPRSIFFLCPIILLFLLCGVRLLAHAFLTGISMKELKRNASNRVLIYGAGSSGIQLSEAILNSQNFLFLGFIDDNKLIQGREINGNRIYSVNELDTLIYQMGVTDVILALPGLTRSKRLHLLDKLREFSIHVRSIPNIDDLASGVIKVSDVKELDTLDLLGRSVVQPDLDLMSRNILSKVVLVTGAGGSIGGELVRQIIRLRPSKLLLVDNSEYSLYTITHQLSKLSQLIDAPIPVIPLLTSVLDSKALTRIFDLYRPHTVFHAAAYKHVPLVECNPIQGLENNIWGTLNAVKASVIAKVEKFVLISTDKAVRPTNVMGASKRVSEMILQAYALTNPATIFCAVRFGNVLDSSGSVVPLFRQQILEGGPITLTHPEVTRYFMTIPEASQLVIQACSMAKGGEVFVLDMGEPVKIIDLARRMVELSGLKVKNDNDPGGDIALKIVGLRPGEKLYEELLIGEDPVKTDHPKIMMAREPHLQLSVLENKLSQLSDLMSANSVEEILNFLKDLPIEFDHL